MLALAEESFGGLYKAWLKNQHRQRKPLLTIYPEGPLSCPAWGTQRLPGCSHELYFPGVLEGGRGEASLPRKPWLAGPRTPSQCGHLEEAAWQQRHPSLRQPFGEKMDASYAARSQLDLALLML